jgi:hypothetical protein
MFDDSGFLSGSGTGQLCRLPDPDAVRAVSPAMLYRDPFFVIYGRLTPDGARNLNESMIRFISSRSFDPSFSRIM